MTRKPERRGPLVPPRILPIRPALAGLLACLGPGAALAQDGLTGLAGGLTATADLSFALTTENGAGTDDSETLLATGIVFGLSSSTRTQGFTLTFGADIDLGDGIGVGGENYEIRPAGALAYIFNNGATELTLSADFATLPVDGEFDIDDDIDVTDLIEDDGTLVSTGFAAGVEFGLDRPIGVALGYSLETRDYQDTSDPGLIDDEVETIEGTLRLTPSELLTFRLSASQIRTVEESAPQVTEDRMSYAAAMEWQATPILDVTTTVSYSEIEEFTGGALTDTTDGIGGEISLLLERPNGTASFDLSREVTPGGDVDRLVIGRALGFADTSTLSASIGVADLPSGDLVAIGTLDWSRPTRDGGLDIGLRREADVNGDDESITRTFLTAGYTYEINAVSAIGLDIGVVQIDNLVTDITTTTRDIGVTYTRELGRDWALAAGVALSDRRDTGAAGSTTREAFVTIGRSFSFRP